MLPVLETILAEFGNRSDARAAPTKASIAASTRAVE
jgi:hypothetical protein